MPIGTYAAFLALATGLAVLVGLRLKRHGDVLGALAGVPPNRPSPLGSVSSLALFGYCLIALGRDWGC